MYPPSAFSLRHSTIFLTNRLPDFGHSYFSSFPAPRAERRKEEEEKAEETMEIGEVGSRLRGSCSPAVISAFR
jgi:hypothetical protein